MRTGIAQLPIAEVVLDRLGIGRGLLRFFERPGFVEPLAISAERDALIARCDSNARDPFSDDLLQQQTGRDSISLRPGRPRSNKSTYANKMAATTNRMIGVRALMSVSTTKPQTRRSVLPTAREARLETGDSANPHRS